MEPGCEPADEARKAQALMRTVIEDDLHARAAIRKLLDMGPAGFDALMGQVEAETVAWKRRSSTFQIIGFAFFLAVLLIFYTAVAGPDESPATSLARNYVLLIAPISICLAVAGSFLLRNEAVRLLAKMDDVRFVGPLIEALMVEDEHTREVVADALTNLLPRLRAGDAGLLNEAHRRVLCRELRGRHVALVRSILKAFEQVGGEEALPDVRRLASGHGQARRNRSLRDEAEECLRYLEARLEKERPARTLLRPADTPGETLLRPAQDVSSPDPSLLLRPAEPGQDTQGMKTTG